MENILLVFGGKSYEHDISIVTASQIYNQTRLENYKLIPIYISHDNRFYFYNKSNFLIEDFSSPINLKNKKIFKEITFVAGENNKVFVKSFWGLKELFTANCALLALHGGGGEDGRIASLFEFFGIKCSAGKFDSLAVCMNKFLFKEIMIGLKIPVVKGLKIRSNQFNRDEKNIISKVKKLQFPVVIKTNSGGSSIGVFVANDVGEFKQKILEAFEFDDDVIVERQIKNCREFNVAVMGDTGGYDVSEVDEPIKKEEIFSFADKYFLGGTNKASKISKGSMVGIKRKLPANIPQQLTDKIKSIALKICQNLNTFGIVRIDFLFDDTKKKLYVCEVNAIPGSLAYYFFCKNSILLNDFTENLIKIAKNQSEKFNNEFVTPILIKDT